MTRRLSHQVGPRIHETSPLSSNSHTKFFQITRPCPFLTLFFLLLFVSFCSNPARKRPCRPSGHYLRAVNSRWNFQPGMKKVRALAMPKMVSPILGKRAIRTEQANITIAWM